MKTRNPNEIKALIEKYIRKECTKQELQVLAEYFKDSPDLDAMPTMQEVKGILGGTQELPADSAERIAKEIMSARLPEKNSSKTLVLKRKKFRRYIGWAAAACLIGVVATSLLWLDGTQIASPNTEIADLETVELKTGEGTVVDLSSASSIEIRNSEGKLLGTKQGNVLKYLPQEEITALEYSTIRIPHGKRFQLQLSDGSIVHLNANSTFRYPINFMPDGKREVFLSGEAYFDVVTDTEHPFIVSTQELDIEVLGTEFSVNAYKEVEGETVVLVEGKVNVSNTQGQSIEMAPNQRVTIQGSKMEKTMVIASELTSWKDGYFTINNAPAKQIIALLEQYYNVTITSQNDQDHNNIIGSGKIYLSDSIENVMTTLSLLTNTNYSFEDKATVNPLSQ